MISDLDIGSFFEENYHRLIGYSSKFTWKTDICLVVDKYLFLFLSCKTLHSLTNYLHSVKTFFFALCYAKTILFSESEGNLCFLMLVPD
jgi:hypothetical protein